MKVSKDWLKQLVALNISFEELEKLLPLRSIGLKEVTKEYFELDMKGYNRADLLSLRGVASEVGAITGSSLTFQEKSKEEILNQWQGYPKTKVEVKNHQLCPVYLIAKIEGLKVQRSSEDWVKKLQHSGFREVNNIADVTNLVMLEYGQPLHAFAADKITNQTLVVRTAKEGEKLLTLDNKERTLLPTDLVIADIKKPVGLAGVMGGKDSEVSETTTTILLEAAIFDPVTLRKTSQRLGLPSEASKRFQHGLTKTRLLQALFAAVKMYEGLGGKLSAVTIFGKLDDQLQAITLSYEHLKSLVGVDIEPDQVKTYLEKLLFQVSRRDLRQWKVIPPYFRLDVDIEADVIEEVARMYGYEKIPPQKLPDNHLTQIDQRYFAKTHKIQEALVDLGMIEVHTYSFYSTQALDSIELKKENLIKVANPMSSETKYLKDHPWPNLVEIVAQNVKKYGMEDIGIFEIGKAYFINQEGQAGEDCYLCLAVSDGSSEVVSELHTIFQKLNQKSGLGLEVLQVSVPEDKKNFFTSNAYGVVENQKGQGVGVLALVHPRILGKLGVEKMVAVLELKL